MAIRIVRLGSPRVSGEGVRLGTVRRPPRGVRRERLAADDWYDVWLPNLAPTQELMNAYHVSPSTSWNMFAGKFRAEMKRPDASHLLDVLAALSHSTNFAIGCYCEDESHCHRGILRSLLVEREAAVA
jgi:uncharacterized protein YeaO (DUF488 family)